jgi:competence protein CoiA
MVWVVDCTHLKHGYSRFLKCYHKLQLGESLHIFRGDTPEECFPAEWLNCQAPVEFDFKGLGDLDDRLGLREPLYCYFPL